MMKTRINVPIWAQVVAGSIVVGIFATATLVWAGGWSWFAKFLENSAAAWVQAVGSIVAIIAAFIIARQQANVDRAQRVENEIVTAEAVGAGVAFAVSQISARLETFQQCLQDRKQGKGLNYEDELNVLQSLSVPKESQIIHLAPVINRQAISLAQGTHLFTMIKNELQQIVNREGVEDGFYAQGRLTSLQTLTSEAITRFAFAQEGLTDLLAHKTFTVDARGVRQFKS